MSLTTSLGRVLAASLLAPCLAPVLVGVALAGEVEEDWQGLDPPVAGEGEPELTVLIRGASEQRPLVAVMGEVRGEVERLGLAIFGVTLRGVPEQGLLIIEDRWGRRTWQGQVRTQGEAVVGFSWVGGVAGRPERLPVPDALPQAQGSRAGPLSLGWLLLWLAGGIGLLRRGR